MPKIRNIIIFIAVAAAFVLIYIFFIKPKGEESNLVSSTAPATLPNIDGSIESTDTGSTNFLINKDFLILFSSVKNIKLYDAIFSDPAFSSLRDSSITLIQDGTEGRPNPFAQFGNDLPAAEIVVPASPSGSTPPSTSGTEKSNQL